MATNLNQEEVNASDSLYSEEEENEVEIFDENGNSFNFDRHICKVVSKVPLIKRHGKRGKKIQCFLDFIKCSH